MARSHLEVRGVILLLRILKPAESEPELFPRPDRKSSAGEGFHAVDNSPEIEWALLEGMLQARHQFGQVRPMSIQSDWMVKRGLRTLLRRDVELQPVRPLPKPYQGMGPVLAPSSIEVFRNEV